MSFESRSDYLIAAFAAARGAEIMGFQRYIDAATLLDIGFFL